MKTHVFAGEVNQIYPDLIHTIVNEGHKVCPRGTVTLELNPAVLSVAFPQRRLVTSYGRLVNVPFALAEVLWILAGRKDVEMLAAYNSQISNYSDNGKTFNAAYGDRIRKAFGHDQLQDMIDCLQRDGDSRQAELVIAHPWYDKSFQDGDPLVTKDRACNVFSHAMIREGELQWLQTIRSNDAIWGVPYNLMQWTHVMEFVAAHLGVGLGTYTAISDSMHIYMKGESAKHFDDAEKVEKADLYKLLPWEHTPMSPISVQDLTYLCIVEKRLRTAQGLSRLEEAMGDRSTPSWLHEPEHRYWRDLLGVLASYRAYKIMGGAINGAGQMLSLMRFLDEFCDDMVYKMATIKFYYKNRYKNNPDAMNALTQLPWAQWILEDSLEP